MLRHDARCRGHVHLPIQCAEGMGTFVLFTPQRIAKVTIPNRIVKSAMAEGRCDAEGSPTPALVRMYERWAAGGVGLAITGMAHTRRGHGFTSGEIGLYDDRQVEPLRALTAAVHRHGGCVFAQICWAPPQISRHKAKQIGATSISAGFNKTNLLFNRGLTEAELRQIVREFAAAARRAREAGFDGVQLHGAHGYLISRSLSPKHNRRTDAWGGSFERRLTLVREMYSAIRAEVGADFPLTIKINAHDGERNGLDLATGVLIAQALERCGFDALEISAGIGDVGLGCYPNKGGVPVDSGTRFLQQQFALLRPFGPLVRSIIRQVGERVAFPGEAYFEPLAQRIAESVTIPVICVGGIRSADVAERILTQTKIAMVSLARPLVRQPDLANHWRAGQSNTAACTSCNECFVQLGFEKPLACHKLSTRKSV